MHYCLVNGARVPEEEATVSVSDRGFRFGDGVFETIRVQDGLPYLWDYHLERLGAGLEALAIPLATESLLAQALEIVEANARADGLLRIQVSRGVGSRGYLPHGAARPTVILQTLPAPQHPTEPVTLWLSSVEKTSPRALPTHFKLAQGLGSTLARMEAERQGCFEALQLAAGGFISEASSANIFWRAGGKIYTPSLVTGALAGVMRRRVMELVPGIAQDAYPLTHLLAADAVILTNSAMAAVGVARLTPHGKSWESASFAEEVNTLIRGDIATYHAHFKRMLART